MKRAALLMVCALLSFACGEEGLLGAIHTAPIVVKGVDIRTVTGYPTTMYHLFKTGADGHAVSIPFQIDEINDWGDYVLPEGDQVTAKTGNGIFDLQDELAFMGDDVGPATPPKTFAKGHKPSILFELKLSQRDSHRPSLSKKPTTPERSQGAVYLGIYFANPPPYPKKSYVVFNQNQGEVITSRYRYRFDRQNWLVAKRVDMLQQGTERSEKPEFLPILDSTTFYLKADLKYFLTVEADHRTINSNLEAYKRGPIRTLVRISFHYNFLRLNFELGMYTEVSFFSNAVYLPAILYNPLDGGKSLNRGSGFYYGLALTDRPGNYKIETNMPSFKKSGILDIFNTIPTVNPLYWITVSAEDRLLYVELRPSDKMRKRGAIPMIYRENTSGKELASRTSKSPQPLGKSPVNMALYFDMTRFAEGEHLVAFRLFFENRKDEKSLEDFKTLDLWKVHAKRIVGQN